MKGFVAIVLVILLTATCLVMTCIAAMSAWSLIKGKPEDRRDPLLRFAVALQVGGIAVSDVAVVLTIPQLLAMIPAAW